jgi:hypothetical protein
MDPLINLLMLHYDKKNKINDDIPDNKTYDYMINKINKTLGYFWVDYLCEYENYDYITNIMLYSVYCSISNPNAELPNDFSVQKIDDMYNSLDDFIEDNFYKLYTSFLLKTNGYNWRWLEDWNFEDLIIVIKFSLIYDEVEIFKIIFDKLDDKIKSYIVHNMDLIYYGFGYPFNIIEHLLSVGYENPINHNLITMSFCNSFKSIMFYKDDYVICLPKNNMNKQNIIKTIIVNDKNFIKDVYEGFMKVTYKNNYYFENVFNLIITYADITNDNKNVIKLFGKNINFLNYLFKHWEYNDYFQIIIHPITFKYYKHLFVNKNFKYKLYILNILSGYEDKLNFFKKRKKWFIDNINCFDNIEKIKIITIFKKLGLLVFTPLDKKPGNDKIDCNNFITNYSVYVKIKKYYPNIKLSFDSNDIYNSLINSNYKDIYNYYCDDNSIECKELKLITISHNIEKIINMILIKKESYYWHNRNKVSKLLNLYEIIDVDKMNNFIDYNIYSLCKCLVNKKIANRINNLNLIDYSQDSTTLYFNFKKMFSKNGISKAINLLKLNPNQYSLIIKKIYRYRANNKLKNILKYRYKLDDNEINEYL